MSSVISRLRRPSSMVPTSTSAPPRYAALPTLSHPTYSSPSPPNPTRSHVAQGSARAPRAGGLNLENADGSQASGHFCPIGQRSCTGIGILNTTTLSFSRLLSSVFQEVEYQIHCHWRVRCMVQYHYKGYVIKSLLRIRSSLVDLNRLSPMLATCSRWSGRPAEGAADGRR